MSARREQRAPVDVATLPHWTQVEVRYGDLDVQGHVNNAVYFTYFEQGRVSFFSELRRLGQAGGRDSASSAGDRGEPAEVTLSPADITFVIVSASCRYRQPIVGLAPVYVGVGTGHVTHATVELRYAVCAAPRGMVFATGETLLASVDLATGRPRALPLWSREGLAQLIGA